MRLTLLFAHAADLGLAVEWADLGSRRGEYRDESKRIILNNRLTRAQATATLAHELGHAHYGDQCSSAAVERRAWRYGARLAIALDDYRDAEAAVGPAGAAIADELGVTAQLVEAWREAFAEESQRRAPIPAPRCVASESEHGPVLTYQHFFDDEDLLEARDWA